MDPSVFTYEAFDHGVRESNPASTSLQEQGRGALQPETYSSVRQEELNRQHHDHIQMPARPHRFPLPSILKKPVGDLGMQMERDRSREQPKTTRLLITSQGGRSVTRKPSNPLTPAVGVLEESDGRDSQGTLSRQQSQDEMYFAAIPHGHEKVQADSSYTQSDRDKLLTSNEFEGPYCKRPEASGKSKVQGPAHMMADVNENEEVPCQATLDCKGLRLASCCKQSQTQIRNGKEIVQKATSPRRARPYETSSSSTTGSLVSKNFRTRFAKMLKQVQADASSQRGEDGHALEEEPFSCSCNSVSTSSIKVNDNIQISSAKSLSIESSLPPSVPKDPPASCPTSNSSASLVTATSTASATRHSESGSYYDPNAASNFVRSRHRSQLSRLIDEYRDSGGLLGIGSISTLS